MIILKKITKSNPVLEDTFFSFVLLDSVGLRSLSLEEALELCEKNTVFAFANVAASYEYNIQGFVSDDFSGSISMKLKFNCALSIDKDNLLYEFLKLLSLENSEKTEWDSDEVFDIIFEKYESKIKAKIYSSLDDIETYLLKKYGGASLMSDSEVDIFNSILPDFINAEYIDLLATFHNQASLASAKDKAPKIDSKVAKFLQDLDKKKATVNIQIEGRAVEVETQKKLVALEREAVFSKLAKEYGLSVENINALATRYPSIDNIKTILAKTKETCDANGAIFSDAIAIVSSAKTIYEAQAKIDAIALEFENVSKFKDAFGAYGLDSVEKVREEFISCGGAANAFNYWGGAIAIKKKFKAAKYDSVHSILALIKSTDVESTLKLYIEKNKKRRHSFYFLVFFFLIFASLVALSIYYYKPIYDFAKREIQEYSKNEEIMKESAVLPSSTNENILKEEPVAGTFVVEDVVLESQISEPEHIAGAELVKEEVVIPMHSYRVTIFLDDKKENFELLKEVIQEMSNVSLLSSGLRAGKYGTFDAVFEVESVLKSEILRNAIFDKVYISTDDFNKRDITLILKE